MTAPSGRIDRRAVVGRHAICLTEASPERVLTVGNGDFAFSADITGMQTFPGYHDQMAEMMRAAATAPDPVMATAFSRPVISLCTMSNWGWHEMPNPEGYVLDDAMSEYDTDRGPVRYPDKYDMAAAATGRVPDELRAGTWLHENPQRLNLGRIGLRLRKTADASPEKDPHALGAPGQRLDMWTGEISSTFTYADRNVRVATVADPERAIVAFRIETGLLDDGRADVEIEFPYAGTGFFQASDWSAPDRHESRLQGVDGGAVIRRTLDATAYAVRITTSAGATVLPGERAHHFVIAADPSTVETAKPAVLELVVSFVLDGADESAHLTFDEVAARAATAWEAFWLSGAALDLSGTHDPRAHELERRAVISQYLTRANCAGTLPPQETGLITNSWQGKFHLEMHLWHAAHFATWGRPELLERSLDWYLSILDVARTTAAGQGFPGARWPKQVGPDGRESPTPIGALLAWQQPHILYMLELVWRASDEAHQAELVERFGELVSETAAFMAAFADKRDGAYHLGPPIMPAQEFYDASVTEDPTFELAYWWWGLEIAQKWQERAGRARDAGWARVQSGLAPPLAVDGVYRAVRDASPLRRDDHPSATAAFGLVPLTPLISPDIMAATLADVLADWDWASSWGWDHPMLAMTAARLGQRELAVDTLLADQSRNAQTVAGHNPQMGAALPIYLPGNGSFLAALSLIAAGADGGTPSAFPDHWTVRAEGFLAWP